MPFQFSFPILFSIIIVALIGSCFCDAFASSSSNEDFGISAEQHRPTSSDTEFYTSTCQKDPAKFRPNYKHFVTTKGTVQVKVRVLDESGNLSFTSTTKVNCTQNPALIVFSSISFNNNYYINVTCIEGSQNMVDVQIECQDCAAKNFITNCMQPFSSSRIWGLNGRPFRI